MEVPEKYLMEVKASVNELPSRDQYVIRTHTEIEYSFKTTVGQYREVRDKICKALKEFYPVVKFKDADILRPYLTVVGGIDDHLCTHVFYMREWFLIEQNGNFNVEINKRLDWGKWNYHRSSSDLPTPKRLRGTLNK